MQIKDKDCVAIEVRHHNSCYRDFTRYLTRPANTQTGSDSSYSEAFEVFSKTVKTRIIDNKEIMRLKKVNDIFIKQIKISHGVEANSYKSGYLKHRLSKKFPQLCFITPHMKSQGDIVYVNDISTATLVEKQTNLQEATQSTTHSEIDSTTDDTEAPSQAGHQSQMGYVYADPNALRNTYMTALDLRQTIREVKPTMPWPPTAEHLNLKEAEAIVPCSLYNFLAWAVGASDEPDTEKMVDVSAPIHRKLLSISQDIISLASKGRKLMPKHMSLAMTVRHLSGSAQLIGLLNGLGHSVSNSVILNHDTALATQEGRRGEDSLRSTIQPGIPTTLVWDNNDFGEETLSGRGTTHNTNGIVVQSNISPRTNQPRSSSTKDPAVKRTRNRSMQLPVVNLATYYGGKKDGPVPFAEHVSLLQSANAPLLQNPMKVDLAYYITKFRTDKILPSWTGFNQLSFPKLRFHQSL
uniref:uncharacterized protein n=1 Tax=Myxine glutinosa TaxID=7769 RepID=UPI00358E324A